MRKLYAIAASIGLVLAAPIALAAYQASILNDGTYYWYWSSDSGVLTLKQGSKAPLSVDQDGGLIPKVLTVATLPTCATALKGAILTVSDATTPTYNGSLTGGGAVVVPVVCDGSAWKSH